MRWYLRRPRASDGARAATRARTGIAWLAVVGALLADPARGTELSCGDTDADGLYETEDIQACLDDLQGPGPHVVTLVPDAVFEPHLDAAPYYNELGFVELASHTTLDCQGSTIRGIGHTAKRAPSAWGPLWVVTNSDHVSHSQLEIWVRNCVIDGGMPASYDEDLEPFDHDIYMGFGLYGVHGGGLIESRVQNTHHACAYVRSSHDIEIDDNEFSDCGGANNQGSFGQPAVYLFQEGEQIEERIFVRRNWAIRAGSSLFATRISEANPQFQTAWMRDVVFEYNYGNQQGSGKPCFVLRGVRGVV
ncbi:MAG TPA: right-handed parallel beta-helix repeat-containing protein, partial [Myxococcota bacterium]|nr:right-handed parallel beta-helix repeat-containing protein [Myxococcota bacterium]